VQDDDDARPTLVDVPPATRSARTCKNARLVEIYGAELGRRVELGQLETVFGRDSDCSVQLDDHTVSRRHAAFRLTGEHFVVADLGSTNGTFVNNSAIQTSVLTMGIRSRSATRS
jgi:pSer/pThr/pTyr-binding forkhead associated (FHA) protein